jgi:hypothetical protein
VTYGVESCAANIHENMSARTRKAHAN